jgi:hypothetical protein
MKRVILGWILATACLAFPAISAQQEQAQRSQSNSAAEINSITHPDERYRLIDLFAGLWFWYCDPDALPSVNVVSLKSRAIQAFPRIVSDSVGFEAMKKRLGLETTTQFSDEQKMHLYREYEMLKQISLEPKDSKIAFSLKSLDRPEKLGTAYNGHEISGVIELDGKVIVDKSVPIFLSCPK